DWCSRCANKLPAKIRARLTSDRPLQTGHLSLRLLLITSQSRQKTAFKRGRPPASNRFFAGSTIHTNLIAGNGQLPFEKSMASITRVHRLSKVSADRSEKASA